MVQLETKRLMISFDEESGVILRLYDKRTGHEYLADQRHVAAFRLELDSGITSNCERFAYTIEQMTSTEAKAMLVWEVSHGLTVIGTIEVSSDSDRVNFYCEVKNDTDASVIGVEYPIISNIQAITANGDDDYVAHSFATGFSIRNPLKHFVHNGLGFRHMPYPESFSGASMQFFTYYGLERGGLYFAALDGEAYSKGLNFYKNRNGLLETSIFHACEQIGPGLGITINYPLVVQALDGEGWQEAADLYKQWASRQFWCSNGALSEDVSDDVSDDAAWLYEDMGIATFGINAMHDRSEWFEAYYEYIRTPMFHILGPDWVHRQQNFYNGVPGGMEDWFPTRFHPNNIRAMKAHGDKYAPFEFDYLYNVDGADGEQGRKALQRFPEGEALRSIDQYHFPLVCPADPYVHELHVRRDERLQEEADVDSIYYDISANNILKKCLDASHGHPVGAGRHITMAYRRNYLDTKAAMMEKAGRYIPMGTEMMNEVFLDVLDYYQARAGGRPAAPLEGWPFRDLLLTGDAQLIPMFTYVYNEYGALRLDGWGKLVEEIGSLFYYTAARTYLWGGLYELNHEYSPMEAIGGRENESSEHYYNFEQRGYELAPERARYVDMLAKVRTGTGNKYLAYGLMLRPLPFQCETVSFDWFHYNCAKDFIEYNESGQYAAESVVHSAWKFRKESVGFFFANVTDEERGVAIELDLGQYDLPDKEYRIRQIINESIVELMSISQGGTSKLELIIPGKSVLLLEVY